MEYSPLPRRRTPASKNRVAVWTGGFVALAVIAAALLHRREPVPPPALAALLSAPVVAPALAPAASPLPAFSAGETLGSPTAARDRKNEILRQQAEALTRAADAASGSQAETLRATADDLHRASEGVAPLPAWVGKAGSARWTWPARVGQASELPNAAAKARVLRLAAWSPTGEEGSQLTFFVQSHSGLREIIEGQLQSFINGGPAYQGRVTASRAEQELGAMTPEQHVAALKKRQGAVSARVIGDSVMVELTYADGHKESMSYDPLVFDLKGRGVQTSGRKTLFDLYGAHRDDRIQWMNDLGEGTGILVFDAYGSGKAGGSGSEVFGDRTDLEGVGRPTGFANGFEALRALVDKAVAAGLLQSSVHEQGFLEADALSVLEKAYGLRMKLGGFHGKTVTLAQAGVKAVALSAAPARRVENFDGLRNDLLVQPGAVFLRSDGSTGYYMNVWLAAKTSGPGFDKER